MKANQNSQVLQHFVQRIYGAVTDPDSIYHVIDDLRQVMESPYSALQIENKYTNELGQAFLIDYDDSAVDTYAEYYITRDPWTAVIIREGLEDKGFRLGQKVVSDKEYKESEFYRDWGKANGVRHALGGGFSIDNGHMVKVSFQRGADQQAFDEDAEYFLNLLHPHLARFVKLSPLYQQGETRRQSWKQVADYLNRPVWVVNHRMQLVYSNSMADEWMTNGHCFRTNNGCLEAFDSAQHKHLAGVVSVTGMAVSDTARWCGQSSHLRQDRVMLGYGNQAENVWVSPVMETGEGTSGLVMITGRKPSPQSNGLERSFGLSGRQAQVCALLMEGRSLTDISGSMNISVNTVRNQLAECFRKLKVSSQAELIKTLYTGFVL